MRRGRRAIAVVTLALLASGGLAAQVDEASTDEASTRDASADPALYAVGALGASNLYATYFLLGTLADGYATAAYTGEFADELARDVIGLGESSIEVLRELLADDGLAGDDRTLVGDMIRAHELLVSQAWGLISYVADGDDTDEWFRYRRAAWELITRLLDLE